MDTADFRLSAGNQNVRKTFGLHFSLKRQFCNAIIILLTNEFITKKLKFSEVFECFAEQFSIIGMDSVLLPRTHWQASTCFSKKKESKR
jgi:hypothetical protein